MGNGLEQIKEQLNDFYKQLSKAQKIKIAVSGLLVVISMALLFYFTSKPEYVVLFNDITPKDRGEITQKLDEMAIPWKTNDAGSSILVQKEDKNKAQANLAVAGLPKEDFSYEQMLDNTSLTMTNEERAKRFLIAQKNELSSVIREIEGVKNAKVNLTVPEDTNFLMQDQKAKASVFVELEPKVQLSKDQVNGIIMIVSNAVKDLDPENVTVVDNRGQVLNKESEDEAFDASTQLNLQHQVQSKMQNSLTEFLSTIYGPENVAVMVNVKLDFDSEVTDVKEFAPPVKDETNGLVRSMNDLKEEVVNGTEGGVPGTDTNSEDIVQYEETDNNNSKYKKSNQVINYELNEMNKKLVKAKGQVKDITVAIVLNKKALPNQELTDEDRKKVVNLVSASTGIDTKVVEVMTKDFDNTLEDEFANMEQEPKGLEAIPLWAMALLGALLIGALGYTVYRVRRRKQEMEEVLETPIPTLEEEASEIEIEVSEKSEYKKQIDKFIDKNPEATAQLLKNWINED
ncbi:flagellar basal-body MS-ring/collar protein FliF [Inediibacterium massiliense]|uniref:flagellar basal-body MS-ring/collar protein FliF n=1 Tax=Inediibacterium massiliense TaxID=1658111 RepID=UPI0006B51581|nr:flagellar basal-body MS-ring/collar protein FliF [Inediibacterium massiliense]